MKAIATFFTTLALIGCASQPQQEENTATESPKPAGQYKKANSKLFAKIETGELTREQAQNIYAEENAECRSEGLRVPVPSPSCTQPPRQDCSGLTGFAAGFCRSYAPPPQCDYSAVNYAKNSQMQVYNDCMTSKGWTDVWVESGKSIIPEYNPAKAAAYRESNSASGGESSPESIQKIVDSIPELSGWQKGNPSKWNLAMSIDDELKGNPAYKSMPMRERFLIVVQKVKDASK